MLPFIAVIVLALYQLVGALFGFPTPDFGQMTAAWVGQPSPSPNPLAPTFRPVDETARPTLPEPTHDPNEPYIDDDDYWSNGEYGDEYYDEYGEYDENGAYIGDGEYDEYGEIIDPTPEPMTLPAGTTYSAGEIASITAGGQQIGELTINSVQVVGERGSEEAAQVFKITYTYHNMQQADLWIGGMDFLVQDGQNQPGAVYDMPISLESQPVGFNQTCMAEAFFKLDNLSDRVTLIYQYSLSDPALIFDVALR